MLSRISSNTRTGQKAGSAALMLALLSGPAAYAQDAPEVVVVTADKRTEAINDVGISMVAVPRDKLFADGIADPSQLSMVVPGFTFTETGYGTPVYTIRGVGFQDNTLSAPPSVSVYVDEVPLPFSIETEGAALDLQRVEVLKGPQGTLYGENSTGGAINYIAAKPTNDFEAGLDASYGNFNTVDLQGYVSGPLTDTLSARLSLRNVESGDWQYSLSRLAGNGLTNKQVGRLLLEWLPTDRLDIVVDLNGWLDRSDSQAAQAYGTLAQSPAVGLFPGVTNTPLAPNNDRAADWDADKSLRGNNWFYQASGHVDYDLAKDLKLTSITAWSYYRRDQPIDTDGSAYNIFFDLEGGHIGTFFQELRISGDWESRLNVIVGANYQSDGTLDSDNLRDTQSSGRTAAGYPLSGVLNVTRQNVGTKAVYGDAEYNILDNLTVQVGARYTDTNRDFNGCSRDDGDGSDAAFYNYYGNTLRGGAPGVIVQPGGCLTINAQTLNSGNVTGDLRETNVSWRAGLKWKPDDSSLLYANISEGYKAGSFPTLSASLSSQFTPVQQEKILAYEAGLKLTLLDGTLQWNAAGWYYDYSNKQIKGKRPDPVFGNIAALVNVPKSNVDGFETSLVWEPLPGLTVAPAASWVESRIDGTFVNFNLLGQQGNFAGEALPYAPKWTGNVDSEYDWQLKGDWNAFIGSNVSFESATNGSFGDLPQFVIKGYYLLDLRAGIKSLDGNWLFSLWGRNVTNTFYYTSASHLADTLTRFTGMPAAYGIGLTYRWR